MSGTASGITVAALYIACYNKHVSFCSKIMHIMSLSYSKILWRLLVKVERIFNNRSVLSSEVVSMYLKRYLSYKIYNTLFLLLKVKWTESSLKYSFSLCRISIKKIEKNAGVRLTNTSQMFVPAANATLTISTDYFDVNEMYGPSCPSFPLTLARAMPSSL